MAAILKEIETQALQLSPQERGELIHRLIVSLEGAPQDSPEAIAQAWGEEIARRVADMEAGRTQWIPADEAMSRSAPALVQPKQPMRISLSDEALADFEAAIDWYLEELAFAAADDSANEFEHALALLGAFPELGVTSQYKMRAFTLPKFPYSLIYRVFPDHIRIIAVAHHSRRRGIGPGGGNGSHLAQQAHAGWQVRFIHHHIVIVEAARYAYLVLPFWLDGLEQRVSRGVASTCFRCHDMTQNPLISSGVRPTRLLSV